MTARECQFCDESTLPQVAQFASKELGISPAEAVESFARIAGEAGADEVCPGKTDAKEMCSMPFAP